MYLLQSLSVAERAANYSVPRVESLSNPGMGNGEKHMNRVVHHFHLSSCHRKRGELKPAETQFWLQEHHGKCT